MIMIICRLRRGRGQYWPILRYYLLMRQKELRATSGMLTYTAELRIEYLTNTSLEHYRYTNLLCAGMAGMVLSLHSSGERRRTNPISSVNTAGTF
jgi:hypothetical protein